MVFTVFNKKIQGFLAGVFWDVDNDFWSTITNGLHRTPIPAPFCHSRPYTLIDLFRCRDYFPWCYFQASTLFNLAVHSGSHLQIFLSLQGRGVLRRHSRQRAVELVITEERSYITNGVCRGVRL